MWAESYIGKYIEKCFDVNEKWYKHEPEKVV